MAQALMRITNLGAQKTSEQLVLGRHFQIKYFVLGAGGHDPSTGLPLSVDQTLVELPAPLFTTPQVLPTGSAYIVGPGKVEYKIVISPSIQGPMSSLGLYAEITSTDNVGDAALIGTKFLHSIANFNLYNKMQNETKTITLRLNSV
jgi:hypothetical protein